MCAGRLSLDCLGAIWRTKTPGRTFQKLTFIKAPPALGLWFSTYFYHPKSMLSTPVNFPWCIHVVFGDRIVWLYNSYALIKLKFLRVTPGLRDMKECIVTLGQPGFPWLWLGYTNRTREEEGGKCSVMLYFTKFISSLSVYRKIDTL